MNYDIKDIGLVIWGCKGGYRIFCSNVVDVNERDISDTLKDIRSYVGVRRHGVDYYAVEFTSRYKVYTHYRSSNDSGAGAFIAITLFVPHTLMITNVREVLDEMVNRYFREYVNPLNGTPLPGKFDEIRPFQNILDTMARVVPDRRMFRYSPSVQNNIPKIVKYDDLATVDRYFDNPYHKEFFDCQEVMFFRRDIVDNRGAYDITFSREPEFIEKVSESVPMNRLLPFADAGVEIKSLRVNGDDYTGHIDEVGLRPEDTIEITLSRPYFHTWEGKGTVEEMVKSGLLSRQGSDYRLVLPRMKPVTHYLQVKVQVNGKEADTAAVAPLLVLSNKAEGIVTAREVEGLWMFTVDGPKVTEEYIVGLFPNHYSKEKFPVGRCRPIDLITAKQPLEVKVAAVVPQVKIPAGEAPKIVAEIVTDNVTLETRFVEGEPLYIPPTAKMSLRAADFTVKLVNGVYEFTPSTEQVKVVLPAIFNRVTGDCRLAVRYEGKDYELKGSVARLPYGASRGQLALSCKNKGGELLVPMAMQPDGTLSVTGTVVNNRLKDSVQLKIDGNIKKSLPGVMAVEKVAKVEFANELDGEIDTISCDEVPGLRVYTIKSRAAAAADVHTDIHVTGPDVKPSDSVTVRFVNCHKYYFDGKKIADGKNYPVEKGKTIVIASKSGGEVAKLLPGDSKQTFGEFRMTPKGEGHYEIAYTPTAVSHILDALLSKAGMIIGAVLLVALVGFFTWLLFFKADREYIYHIKLEVAKPDNVASITPLDSLDRILVPQGATLRFIRTKPVSAIAGTERMVIDYGTEGKDTLTVAEAVREEISAVKTFLTSEKPQEAERTVSLSATPAARRFAELRDLRSPMTAETLAEFKAQYPSSRYVDSIQAVVNRAEQAALEAEEKAKAEAEAYESVAKPYRDLVARLDRMDCSKSDVVAIEAYEAAHKDVIAPEIGKYAAKVKAYKTFFDPKQSPKSSSHFTKDQQKACVYYIKYHNAMKKDDPKRDFNYAAQQLKVMGGE